tara:strand:+ start:155 stop:394 length:240 start_codon:yes stop_codon:yes gene_type:complete
VVASEEELSVLAEELSVLAVLLSSDEHEETSTAMLTIRTNQEVRFFILLLYIKFIKAGLKSHKFKLFNPFDILIKKTKY